MSDLSQPPFASQMPGQSTLDGLQALTFQWPSPQPHGYPAPAPLSNAEPCELEALDGGVYPATLLAVDAAQGTMYLQGSNARGPAPYRLNQFRRLTLLRPLTPDQLIDIDQVPVPEASAKLPRTIACTSLRMVFRDSFEIQVRTLDAVETALGVFTFAPMGDHGELLRSFYPRPVLAALDPTPREPSAASSTAAEVAQAAASSGAQGEDDEAAAAFAQFAASRQGARPPVAPVTTAAAEPATSRTEPSFDDILAQASAELLGGGTHDGDRREPAPDSDAGAIEFDLSLPDQPPAAAPVQPQAQTGASEDDDITRMLAALDEGRAGAPVAAPVAAPAVPEIADFPMEMFAADPTAATAAHAAPAVAGATASSAAATDALLSLDFERTSPLRGPAPAATEPKPPIEAKAESSDDILLNFDAEEIESTAAAPVIEAVAAPAAPVALETPAAEIVAPAAEASEVAVAVEPPVQIQPPVRVASTHLGAGAAFGFAAPKIELPTPPVAVEPPAVVAPPVAAPVAVPVAAAPVVVAAPTPAPARPQISVSAARVVAAPAPAVVVAAAPVRPAVVASAPAAVKMPAAAAVTVARPVAGRADDTELPASLIRRALAHGVRTVHLDCPSPQSPMQLSWRLEGRNRALTRWSAEGRVGRVESFKRRFGLDAGETRRPQQAQADLGSFCTTHAGTVRLQTVPTGRGLEDLVLHLEAEALPDPKPTLDRLGLPAAARQSLERDGAARRGLWLVATGADATLGRGLLTSLLALSNDGEQRVWSAEAAEHVAEADDDDGIRRLAVEPGEGLGWEEAMESLRHADADAALIGRLGSPTMFGHALAMAGQGRAVLAGVDAPDALSALTGLAGADVDADAGSRHLAGVLVARRAPGMCPHCASERPAREDELKAWADAWVASLPANGRPSVDAVRQRWIAAHGRAGSLQVREATGCDHCLGTGEGDEQWLTSVWRPSPAARQALAEGLGGRAPDVLAQKLAAEGLANDTLLKIEAVLDGQVSPRTLVG